MRQVQLRVRRGGSARAVLLLALAGILVVPITSACGSGDPFAGGEAEAGAPSAGEPNSPAGGAPSMAGSQSSAGDGGDVDPGAAGSDSGGAGSGRACAVGTADCNDDAADGCETKLDSDAHCGSCDKACTGSTPYCASAAGEHHCVNPAQALAGARLELPCASQDLKVPELCESVAQRDMNCPMGGKTLQHSLTLDGREGALYDVTVRVRGVLEPKVYEGGEAAGDHFYVGGSAKVSNYNTFSIAVSEPKQIYYLNHDSAVGEQYFVFPLDHSKVIRVAGGATITLGVSDPDCAMVKNCKSFVGECQPYVIEGVSPAPDGFSGQFAQLDVVSVALAP